AALGPGDVTDSNSLLLALRAREAGARDLVTDVQPDDPDVIAAEVRRAALAADLVLVIAGSSAGRSDHTAAVLGQAGGPAARGRAEQAGSRVDQPAHAGRRVVAGSHRAGQVRPRRVHRGPADTRRAHMTARPGPRPNPAWLSRGVVGGLLLFWPHRQQVPSVS